MRRTSRTGSFFMVLLFNLLINFYLTIPGWILLILHFIIPQYIQWWYCLIYFGAVVLYLIIWMLVIGAVSRWVNTAEPTKNKENINPYSSTGYKPVAEQKKNLNPYSSKGYQPYEHKESKGD